MRFIFRLVSMIRDLRAASRGKLPQRLARKSLIRRVNRHIR
jgi:hypothetical protein